MNTGSNTGEKTNSNPQADASQNSAKVLDWEGLMERLMDDVDLAKKVMAIFVNDSQKQFTLLKVAIQENKTDLVERQAHTIKGGASNIGLEKVRCIAYTIEEAARNNDVSLASTYMPDLENALQEAIVALQERL